MEITELNVKNYPDFLALYNEAFPAEERRPYKDAAELERFIKMKGGKFHAYAAKDGDLFLGFLSYWIFEGYVYVEHFAVQPQHRGRNIGRRMLAHLMKEVSQDILLEVEKPVTDEARRRIRFYEEQGFRVRKEFDYEQPPYTRGGKPVPMLLMTHGDVSLRHYKDMEPMLREVYNLNTL